MDAEAFEQYKHLNVADPFVAGALQDLIAEVERLSALVEKYIDPSQVMLTGMNVQNGSFDVGLEGGACKVFAGAFAEQFKQSEATNYIEMHLMSTDPEIGELVLTLQRKQGKTPNEMQREAERERDEARALISVPAMTFTRFHNGHAYHADGLSRELATDAFNNGHHTVEVYYGLRCVYTTMAEFDAAYAKGGV